jgi:hypothetical protein
LFGIVLPINVLERSLLMEMHVLLRDQILVLKIEVHHALGHRARVWSKAVAPALIFESFRSFNLFRSTPFYLGGATARLVELRLPYGSFRACAPSQVGDHNCAEQEHRRYSHFGSPHH